MLDSSGKIKSLISMTTTRTEHSPLLGQRSTRPQPYSLKAYRFQITLEKGDPILAWIAFSQVIIFWNNDYLPSDFSFVLSCFFSSSAVGL